MDDLIKKFSDSAKMSFSELWAKNKMFLIVFGLLLLVIKFHDLIFDALVNSSKKLVKEADQKSEILLNEQNQASSQAHELIKESQQLSENRPVVDVDWYKDEKK